MNRTKKREIEIAMMQLEEAVTEEEEEGKGLQKRDFKAKEGAWKRRKESKKEGREKCKSKEEQEMGGGKGMTQTVTE